jgi:hypothetical protein
MQPSLSKFIKITPCCRATKLVNLSKKLVSNVKIPLTAYAWRLTTKKHAYILSFVYCKSITSVWGSIPDTWIRTRLLTITSITHIGPLTPAGPGLLLANWLWIDDPLIILRKRTNLGPPVPVCSTTIQTNQACLSCLTARQNKSGLCL